MNWTLISGISSALNGFEEQFGWSMSVGENACFFEVLYPELKKGLPESKDNLREIFEKAYVNTWGEDHECHETENGEMEYLLICCIDYFNEINPQRRSKIVEDIMELVSE